MGAEGGHEHPKDNRFLPEFENEGAHEVTISRNATDNLLLQVKVALLVFEDICGSDRSCAMNEWMDRKGVKGYDKEYGPAFEFCDWVEKKFHEQGTEVQKCIIDEMEVEKLAADIREKFNPTVH